MGLVAERSVSAHTLSASASVPEEIMAIPMKAMRTSASKRKSIIARGIMAKSVVFRGSKEKTTSGLTKSMLHKNKRGKIVSKKQTAAGRKAYSKIAPWTKACTQAKKSLNIKGFVLINGKTSQGKALYAKAKSLYNA